MPNMGMCQMHIRPSSCVEMCCQNHFWRFSSRIVYWNESIGSKWPT